MSSIIAKIKDSFGGLEKGELVGIDIGLSAVKLAELSHAGRGKYKLNKYASIPLSEAAIIEDEIQKPDEILVAIKDALRESKISKKICNMGIDGPHTMTKRLQVPNGKDDDIEDNVVWETEQYIPFGAEDSELDFSILNRGGEDDIVDVIVAAAKTPMIESYKELVEEAGMSVRNVDLNVFAITNLFEIWSGKNLSHYSERGVILIDFGAQTTTVIVYKNNGPILTKEINYGGVLVTEEIQRTLGVSYEEAEDLKMFGDDNGNLPEEVLEVVYSQVATMMTEIKKVLNFFVAVGSSDQVAHCFITGGTALLPGLPESLEETINIDVEFLNPFDVIDYNTKSINEDEINEMGLCGAVALGLALRKV